MRKFKYVATLLSAILLALAGAACGGSGTLPEKYGPGTFELINAKLGEDGLSEADYAKCIKWYGEAQKEYLDSFQKCVETSETMEEFAEQGDRFNGNWEKKWPQMEKLKTILLMAKKEDMGAENMADFEACQNNIADRMKVITLKLNEKYQIDLNAVASEQPDSASSGKRSPRANR